MAKTVVGLMDSFREAQQVVNDLVDSGFDREAISLLAQDEQGQYTSHEAGKSESGKRGEGAMKGAGAGAALGGVGGLVIGLTGLAIPGLGPIIAAGPLAAALAGAGVGAVAGGVIGGLTKLGVPEEDAHYYAEGVRRGGVLVTVASDDARAEDAADIMRRHGAIDIDKRAEEWRSSGWSRFDESAAPAAMPGEREGVIPVVEEDIDIGKRQVDTGGVRVQSHVTEEPVEKDVLLREERAKIERRPVDRPLAASESSEAFRETSIDIPETSEEPVISKQARVKEEISLGREERERTELIRETARRTDVDIQGGRRDEGFLEPDDEDFRNHFQSYYAQRGEDYQGFRSAYHFGARMSQQSNREWMDMEEDIHRDWDRDHPGTWSKYKEAIHYGWEKSHRH